MKRRLVHNILSRISPLYATQPMGLAYQTPFQLLVATILSAQCTDKRVSEITALFFDRLCEPADYLALSKRQLEKLIKPTGFYHNKAKNILGAARVVLDDYNGRIPDTINELVKIPGVGRKTANVLVSRLYGKNEGVCVDTHVLRLSGRLGLSKHTDAVRVEHDLMAIVPQDQWALLTHCLILHGRQVCVARRPKCEQCVVSRLCLYFKKRDR